jgi:phage/plasmid-like protein (TIGR03299 family)
MDEIEINKQTGAANFFAVKEPAWHGLGVLLSEPPTVKEGIVLAGLDWKVRLQPLFTKYDGEEMAVPGWHTTIRDTDRKVLGVVGPTFKPLQNIDAFEFFQPWIDEGLATLETAGSLRGGKRVWVMAKLKSDNLEIVKGDEVTKYILLSNGHDGTLAVRAGLSLVRVVCANTMAEAHGSKTSKLLRIRHSNKTVEALKNVRDVMSLAEQEFEASADQFRALARKGINSKDLTKYVTQVFKPKVIDGGLSEGDDENECGRIMEKVLPLFEAGRGTDIPGVRGTLWGAVNSISEYLQYERGSSDEGRLHSLWFGDSARLNQRALQVAMQMVG